MTPVTLYLHAHMRDDLYHDATSSQKILFEYSLLVHSKFHVLNRATYHLFPMSIAEEDFHEVYRELWTIKANYHQLGVMLGLPPGELQTIKLANSQNVAQAFTDVLLTWLRQQYNVHKRGHPTWQRLVEAVDSPCGGSNPALAIRIAESHLTPSMNHL